MTTRRGTNQPNNYGSYSVPPRPVGEDEERYKGHGNRAAVEDENESLTEGLRDKIRALKSVSVEIGDEVRYHNKLLMDMDDDFEKNKGFLSSTMARVIKLGKAGHNYYLFYLLIFAFVVFFLIWFIKKLG